MVLFRRRFWILLDPFSAAFSRSFWAAFSVATLAAFFAALFASMWTHFRWPWECLEPHPIPRFIPVRARVFVEKLCPLTRIFFVYIKERFYSSSIMRPGATSCCCVHQRPKFWCNKSGFCLPDATQGALRFFLKGVADLEVCSWKGENSTLLPTSLARRVIRSQWRNTKSTLRKKLVCFF